jgi:hypothetical protein
MAENDFERWVRNGLGRAALWFDEHDDEAVRDVLLDTCVRETAYDRQLEGSRAGWIYDLIGRTRDPAVYRARVLHALREATGVTPDDEFVANLAGFFAYDGDRELGDLIRDKARSGEGPLDRFVVEVAFLDGIPGLVRLARERPAGRRHSEPVDVGMALSNRDGGDYEERLEEARAADPALADLLTEPEHDPSRELPELDEGAAWVEVRPALAHPDAFYRSLRLRSWGGRARRARSSRRRRISSRERRKSRTRSRRPSRSFTDVPSPSTRNG